MPKLNDYDENNRRKTQRIIKDQIMQTYKVVFEEGQEIELSGTDICIEDKRIITVVQEIDESNVKTVAVIPAERLLYIKKIT